MKEYPRNVHHGFLIVRLPEYNFDAEGRGFSKEAPKLGPIMRQKWHHLENGVKLAINQRSKAPPARVTRGLIKASD
jgi:hypothetical protein